VANNGGPCHEADGFLVFTPNLVVGGAGLGTLGSGFQITPSLVFVGAVFDNGPGVFLTASNGASGVVVLTPGLRKCVAIQGLTITTQPC
jgi:hypothetical protein